jgi:hypothetical protein
VRSKPRCVCGAARACAAAARGADQRVCTRACLANYTSTRARVRGVLVRLCVVGNYDCELLNSCAVALARATAPPIVLRMRTVVVLLMDWGRTWAPAQALADLIARVPAEQVAAIRGQCGAGKHFSERIYVLPARA